MRCMQYTVFILSVLVSTIGGRGGYWDNFYEIICGKKRFISPKHHTVVIDNVYSFQRTTAHFHVTGGCLKPIYLHLRELLDYNLGSSDNKHIQLKIYEKFWKVFWDKRNIHNSINSSSVNSRVNRNLCCRLFKYLLTVYVWSALFHTIYERAGKL